MKQTRSTPMVAAQDAQSITVGFFLILSTVLIFATIYIPLQIPLVTEANEFHHADAVLEDFIFLDISLKDLARAASAGASTSVPVQMTPDRESGLSLSPASGSLLFAPTAGLISVALNGTGTGDADVWIDDAFTNTTSSNVETASGNVSLCGPPYLRGSIESNFSAVSGHSGKDTGNDNMLYTSLSWHTHLPSNTRIILQVRTDMFPDMSHAQQWHDCPAIESRNGANTVALSDVTSVSNGHRYIQYRAELHTWDPAVTPTLYNLSLEFFSPLETIVLANSSGTLTYTSNYYYLPNYNLTYGTGALIKNQEEGGFVVCSSLLAINTSDARSRINLSLTDLTGKGAFLTGGPINVVRLFQIDQEDVVDAFWYPSVTLTFATAYPAIWTARLNKTLDAAELTTPDHYRLSSDPLNETVTLAFYGHGNGVQLHVEKTTFCVELMK